LTDRQGRVAGHSEREALGKPLRRDALQALPELGADVDQFELGGKVLWGLRAEALPKGFSSPVGEVHVALSQHEVLASIRQAALRQGAVAAVLLLLGAGLSVLMVRVLVGPLRER
jgi:hypothetical protein